MRTVEFKIECVVTCLNVAFAAIQTLEDLLPLLTVACIGLQQGATMSTAQVSPTI